jgi:hypothetical protein
MSLSRFGVSGRSQGAGRGVAPQHGGAVRAALLLDVDPATTTP